MKKLWALVGVVFFFIPCAYAAPVATDLQKSLFVSPKYPTVTVQLKSNATTGYSWLLTYYDHHLFQLESHRYVAPAASKMVGVGGMEVWTFKAKSDAFLAPQLSDLEFIYAHPWELQKTEPTVIHVVTQQS